MEATAKLTRLQAALRDYLRLHSGATVPREQLSSDVWQMSYFQSSRTIDQTLSVVRKHLGDDERIITVFGIGYRHEFLSRVDTSCRSERVRCRPLESLSHEER